MRRNGDRGLVGGDREILDRGYGFHRTGDRWLPDRWLGMPSQGPVIPPGPPPFDPTTIPGLWGWWKMDSISQADGSEILGIPDSSPANHPYTGPAGFAPKFYANVLNGKPVMRFSGATQIMSLATGLQAPWTIISVQKPATPGSELFQMTNSAQDGPHAIDFFGPGGSVFFSPPGARYQFAATPSMAALGGEFRVWRSSSDAGIAFSGGVGLSYVTALGWPNDPAGLNQLGRRGTSALSSGDIAEMFAYNAIVSDSDYQKLLDYLIDRFALPHAPDKGLADGAAVSTWGDSSPARGQAKQATAAKKPIFKTNVLNGKPVLRLTSAAQSGLDLVAPISGAGNWTCFAVMKPTGSTVKMWSLVGSSADSTPYGPVQYLDGNTYAISRGTFVTGAPTWDAFHVLTADIQEFVYTTIYKDGSEALVGAQPFTSTGDFSHIGYGINNYSDGDLAEIIFYSGPLALRLKLSLLLVTLLTTGQLPGPEVFDAMVGDHHKIRRYLHQHGAHPTQAQLNAVVTPMAVGDRANIEKYLGTKYGIAVAGGTAVDPTTVAGLLAWYKADSLL